MTRWTSFWIGVRIRRKPRASATILLAKLASPTAVTSYQPEPDMQNEPDETVSPADLWIASDSPVSWLSSTSASPAITRPSSTI